MTQTNTQRPVWDKALILGFLLAAVLAASLALAASEPADAATTFIVNLTGDQTDFSGSDGRCDTDSTPFNGVQCTLRAAIQRANATPGTDTINFNIQSIGVMTISVASDLPDITDALTIDGYSQPGSSPNTLAKGTNAVIKIQLDGNNTAGNGLEIVADVVVVRGLAIGRFNFNGIEVDNVEGVGAPSGVRI